MRPHRRGTPLGKRRRFARLRIAAGELFHPLYPPLCLSLHLPNRGFHTLPPYDRNSGNRRDSSTSLIASSNFFSRSP